jgi:hypothetical protein
MRRKRVCVRCRGSHLTQLCPNRSPAIRQFGTVDQDRKYVPPEGVQVRVIQIPRHVHGDQLEAFLNPREEP